MDGDKHWYDDDRLYPSVSNSDDSPILSHRYCTQEIQNLSSIQFRFRVIKRCFSRRWRLHRLFRFCIRGLCGCNERTRSRRFSPYAAPKIEERERRSTLTYLAKFFLFSTAMILFCVLLYIPVYNKANDQLSKGLVAGWSIHTNRDTKIYVQPKNVTTIHSPSNICPRTSKNKLFLLIVVCSSTLNFEQRLAIRETWGNYRSYLEMSKLYHAVKQRYINYNFTYDLYSEQDVTNASSDRVTRDISSFSRLLPELAKALQDNLVIDKTDDVPEKRFDDEIMLPEFDMNQELGENTEPNYDYYETNVMKIPPKGYEDTPDLEKVLSMLKGNKNFQKMKEKLPSPDIPGNTDPDFKIVFLLGLPTHDNDSSIQNKIEEETDKYGDIIQEAFIDSYNNLTLKSIMMLKWITNNCNDSVRYILKTDDDMYINVPNLMDNLRNRSHDFDAKAKGRSVKEYMLIGDLICGAKPVQDTSDKWYSPKYMYGGRVYPKYLSGTAYALSADAARALYTVALRTTLFHLEDVFLTGICASRARPRIVPRDDPTFSFMATPGGTLRCCLVHARANAHRVPPDLMRRLHVMMRTPGLLDRCERMRLTKVRKDRLKPKTPPKRLTKH